MEWYTFFIVMHAVSASLSLIAGAAVLWPPRARHYPWLFTAFFASLISMAVFVGASIASHWTELDVAARLSFSGLALLAVYMVYRAVSARRKRPHAKQSDGYIDDVGFVLIALVVGLVILPLIRLEVAIWAAALVIGLTILGGSRLLKWVHARYQRQTK